MDDIRNSHKFFIINMPDMFGKLSYRRPCWWQLKTSCIHVSRYLIAEIFYHICPIIEGYELHIILKMIVVGRKFHNEMVDR
uniref:Putative ovule protein n=1 Tax=Solanum chacoense TaxID=4108 RepID=A0A0V0GLU8_SOLCH